MASCGLILDDIIVSSIASAATYGRSAARSWNGRKEPREREVEQQLLLDDVHDVIVVEQLLCYPASGRPSKLDLWSLHIEKMQLVAVER